MKPIYKEGYITEDLYEKLVSEVSWINRDAPRDECFMALENLEYAYGSGGFMRNYKSVPMDDTIRGILNKLNKDFSTEYNVCFLNYYKNEREHLGWHSDDSPEMDGNHSIGVISFGAERYIWCKDKDFKGEIPNEDRYLLENGSLFVMPAGYQTNNLHRIPKHDRKCGGRVSLTFRKYKAGD